MVERSSGSLQPAHGDCRVFGSTCNLTHYDPAVQLAGDTFIHVQMANNDRGTPGTGSVRWDLLRQGLQAINYGGVISIESFTPEIKELAGAVCIWRHLAPGQDQFASEGLAFMKKTFNY